MLTAYSDAFNRHSVEDAVACFTSDGIMTVNYPSEIYQGHVEISERLSKTFEEYPDITAMNPEVTKLEVVGEKATVQIKYRISASALILDVSFTEDMELVS